MTMTGTKTRNGTTMKYVSVLRTPNGAITTSVEDGPGERDQHGDGDEDSDQDVH